MSDHEGGGRGGLNSEGGSGKNTSGMSDQTPGRESRARADARRSSEAAAKRRAREVNPSFRNDGIQGPQDPNRGTSAAGGLEGSETAARAEVDKYNAAADASWDAGDYGSWVSNKASAFGQDVANSFNEGWANAVEHPTDFAAEVMRNPFAQIAATVANPAIAAGMAGLAALDNAQDYLEGDVSGMEAVRGVAGDIAGVLSNPAARLGASFVASPEDTLSGVISGGLSGALGDSLGEGVGSIAANVGIYSGISSGIDSLTGGDALAGTVGTLGNIGTGTQTMVKRGSNGAYTPDKMSVASTGNAPKQVYNSEVTTSTGGYVAPNVANLNIGGLYGMNQPSGVLAEPSTLPSTNFLSQIKGSTNKKNSGKMDTKVDAETLRMMELYPWLYGQGSLTQPTNLYV